MPLRPKVININQAPYGWTENPAFVYVGREGRGFDGYFGNPIEPNKLCPVCGQMHQTKGSTVPCFRKLATERIKSDEQWRDAIANLANKTLVCFCKPKPCHGDVLADLCAELNSGFD